MHKFYVPLFASLLICGFTACQKGGDGGTPYNASNLILGKWSLQKQKISIYVNGVVQLDTTCERSFTNSSQAQFNKDNTFGSIVTWGPGGYTDHSGNANAVAAVISTTGTYRIVNSSLNTSAALAGLYNWEAVGFSDATNFAIQPTNVVSSSSQITLLTSSQFNLHYELVYNIIINNVTTNYKEEDDYYYTR